MSKNVSLTGNFLITDAITGKNTVNQILSDAWSVLTGMENISFKERNVNITDGAISLDLSGASSVSGILLYVTSGTETVTLKQNGQSIGTPGNFFLMQATLTGPVTIQTTSATDVPVEYITFS